MVLVPQTHHPQVLEACTTPGYNLLRYNGKNFL